MNRLLNSPIILIYYFFIGILIQSILSFSNINSEIIYDDIDAEIFPSMQGLYRIKKQLLSKHIATIQTKNYGKIPIKFENDKESSRQKTFSARLPLKTVNNDNDDFESLLAVLQDEVQFVHSAATDVSKSSPCTEVKDRNTTMLRSIGKLTRTIVNLRSNSQFETAYCAGNESPERTLTLVELFGRDQSVPRSTNSCAVDSQCSTIYRWKKAEIESGMSADGVKMLLVDDVLIPSGCTCVINALRSGFSEVPIIIF